METANTTSEKKGSKGMFGKLFGLVLILTAFAAAWVWQDFEHFLETPLHIPEKGLPYTLKPGTTLRAIATEMEVQEVISNQWYLRFLGRWDKTAQRIKAGEYHIDAGTTPRALLALFVAGKVTQYPLTLVEGWNFLQVIEAVNANAHLSKTLKGLDNDSIMEKLNLKGIHPEGRFFPDTYYFPKGTSDIDFLKRAYQSMETLLKVEWEKREEKLPYKTAYEALTMASIIERETGQPSERAEIGGVFVRRLRKGMKLQTDPTVIYGMGSRYKGNIRRRDLREDTPYNTYVHTGLPPTPISMPGADSIRAALHPGKGKTLYFVAKGDGSHKFSATLVEHNKAVRKYQLKK